MKLELKTLEDTEQLGAKLWEMLPLKSLVFLNGELGAGKTTLVRGVLRAAGFIRRRQKSDFYYRRRIYHCRPKNFAF
jgi:tRNA A37 threonylcarbamoyladenosine biosynthesis protein TsaE